MIISTMLTDDQIQKFQSIYAKRFGVELDKKIALEKGIKLVRLIELIYKPITKHEYENLVNHNSSQQDK
jgi:hypothetical protein